MGPRKARPDDRLRAVSKDGSTQGPWDRRLDLLND